MMHLHQVCKVCLEDRITQDLLNGGVGISASSHSTHVGRSTSYNERKNTVSTHLDYLQITEKGEFRILLAVHLYGFTQM